jgi:hypothetical protein
LKFHERGSWDENVWEPLVWDTPVAVAYHFLVFVIGIIGERLVAASCMNFSTMKTTSLVCECSFFPYNFNNVGGISQYHTALFYGMLMAQVIIQAMLFP